MYIYICWEDAFRTGWKCIDCAGWNCIDTNDRRGEKGHIGITPNILE